MSIIIIYFYLDYQDDIARHMQAATEFLQRTMDAVDGAPGNLIFYCFHCIKVAGEFWPMVRVPT